MAKFTIFVPFLIIIAVSVIIQESSARSIRSEPPWRQNGETENPSGLIDKEFKQDFEEAFRVVEELEQKYGRSLVVEELQALEKQLEKDPKYYKFAKFVTSQYNSSNGPVRDSLSKRQSPTDGTEAVKRRYPEYYPPHLSISIHKDLWHIVYLTHIYGKCEL
ncbi:unnamed protein product [Allacma fusca]|uniref:Uncharacterized protein n=1 Tax=Allacma fusca TaxID=39272 RepID=A0A8J2PFD5_9HEXA|nr:unnamed protein product [Allacma fusca]